MKAKRFLVFTSVGTICAIVFTIVCFAGLRALAQAKLSAAYPLEKPHLPFTCPHPHRPLALQRVVWPETEPRWH